MKQSLLYLFLLSISFFPSQGKGQSFHFNRQLKGIELPTDHVYEVVQDDQGLIWMHTNAGIFYSDGFRTYAHEVNREVSSRKLLQDEENVLWLVERGERFHLHYLREGIWYPVHIPEEIETELLAGYASFKVSGSGSAKRLILHTDATLNIAKIDGHRWERFAKPKSVVGELKSVYCYRHKLALFFEHAIFDFHSQKLTQHTFSSPILPAPVFQMDYDESTGKFYYLGNGFLAEGSAFLHVDRLLLKDFTRNTFSEKEYFGLRAHQGKVFFFFNSQLHQFISEQEEFIHVDATDFIKAYHIFDFLVDRESIIWIATHRGLLNINSLRFQNYTAGYFPDDEVTALHQLPDGDLLVGFNHAVVRWDMEQEPKKLLLRGSGLQPKYRVTNFHAWKENGVYFSSGQGGVGYLDLAQGSVLLSPSPNADFITSVHVVEDELFILGRKRVYRASPGDQGDRLYREDITDSLLQTLDQRFGYLRKIDKLHDGRYIFLQGGEGVQVPALISGENFLCFNAYSYLEEGDSILLGTSRGLKIYKADSLYDFSWNSQKFQNPVYALMRDRNGMLWMGTDRGVTTYREGSLRVLDEKSGLAGSEVNRSALLEFPEKGVLIGTQFGLSVYRGQEDAFTQPPPRVSIIATRLPDQQTDTVKGARIRSTPYSKNNVSISYRATSFSQLSNLVIRYRLDGLHKEWQELINPRLNVLYFDNLPPGTYQLQLQAGFGNQVISEIVTSEPFRINPPLYLTWWFLLLLFLFTLGLGILIASFWRQYRDKGELRRAIDEKIKEAFTMEEQFRNVWNSSRDGLLLSIEGGKIIAANPALANLVGLEEKTIEEGYIKDLFTDPFYYEQQRPKILSLIETTSSQSATLELLMPFKAGEKLIEIYATRLNTSFKGKGVLLSVFQDVTEMRAYERGLKDAKERAEEANRMKSNFISNISHEIRTPLNGIMGSTEYIISQRKKDVELCRQLEIILESGERLLHTINSILDLSKIEANKVGLEIEEVEINDFLARLLLPLKTLAMNKGLLVSTKYETPQLKVTLDKRYFAMIVNNLVGNAIKYSDKGLIHIRLYQQDSQFIFTVDDQGIGMSDHFMEKLFQPFEQESVGYSRSYEGTGLGLAITKNAVQLMGGTIDVSSKKGEGTRVTILLPVNQNHTFA